MTTAPESRTRTVRLHIAYDGTGYVGWQEQREQSSIEGTIKSALRTVLGHQEVTTFQGASRTDAGVHAIGQVASFEHTTNRLPWDFVRGLNALTPPEICINHAEETVPGFNARFSSRGKRYRYRIWNHRFAHPLEPRAWRVQKPIDVDAMQKAATHLLGEHDFASFQATGCQAKTTVRSLSSIEVVRTGPWVHVTVEGTAFLRHMVRILVGTLVEFGHGRAPAELGEILEARDRCAGGRTAPATGLTLMEVFYPDAPWNVTPKVGLEENYPRSAAPQPD